MKGRDSYSLPNPSPHGGGNRKALYPGSFDPFSKGHLEILEMARRLFDEVVVGIAATSSKSNALFTLAERVDMIKAAVGPDPGVTVISYSGLTVEFARQLGIQSLIRGVRCCSDFEDELQKSLLNRQLAPEMITVFLSPSTSNLFVSSGLIKEVAAAGGSVDDLVPPPVANYLREKLC